MWATGAKQLEYLDLGDGWSRALQVLSVPRQSRPCCLRAAREGRGWLLGERVLLELLYTKMITITGDMGRALRVDAITANANSSQQDS